MYSMAFRVGVIATATFSRIFCYSKCDSIISDANGIAEAFLERNETTDD
jgi:hypothetical protein